jgi:hypothetical protein
MNHDLSKSLADVRMAYRLVAEYQARVFAILKFIEQRLPEFEFLYWSPARWDTPPNRGSNPLRKWPADGLPFYTFSLLCTQAGENRETLSEWMLEIHHEADDGVQNDDFVDNNTGPIFSRLAPAAESRSEVHLLAWRRNAGAGSTGWRWLWDNSDWPEQDDVLEDSEDGHLSIIRRRIDLSTLSSREGVEAAVDDFRRLMTGVGVPLVSADNDRVTV